MTLTNEMIQQKVEEEYYKNCNLYGTKRILGTYLVGKVNYGFSREEEDLRYITIYIPSFEDLCLNHYPAAELQDLRKIYNILQDKTSIILETLYSNFMYINPLYEKIFNEELYKNREIIARLAPQLRAEKVYKYAKAAYARKDYFEYMRLRLALELYIGGAPLEDCYHIKNLVYTSLLNDYCNGKVLTEEEYNKFNEFFEYSTTIEIEPNPKAYSIVKQGILDIIHLACHEAVSWDSFVESLTSTEKDALSTIKNKCTNDECNISISKIIEETGISRPVYKNLFVKLKESNIAEVVNRGAKGTYIKFK